MKKILIITLLLVAGNFAYAQEWEGTTPPDSNSTTQGSNSSTQSSNSTTHDSGRSVLPKISNPLKFKDLPSLVNGIVELALKAGTIIAVLALVWVGFKFIIAQGNPGEITKAKEAFKWVIIGIAILFSAQIIVEIIKGTLSDFIDPTKI